MNHPNVAKVLDVRSGEEHLGEHPYMVWIFADFAPVRLAQGRYAEAEELCQRAISLATKLYGEAHPDVARGVFNLADVYAAQERYAKAEVQYRLALAIRTDTLPPDHPDVERTRDRLSALLAQTGRPDEAAELRAASDSEL